MAFIAPGVYTREIDLSQYAPALATSIFGVVGIAPKGPVNDPTLITNELDLFNVFGQPTPTMFALYAAQQYLKQGRQLRFVRVTDGTEAIASEDIDGNAQVAFFKGTSNIGAGVDLSVKNSVNLTRDGVTVASINLATGFVGPLTSVTLDHIISRINNADASFRSIANGGTAQTDFASKDNLNNNIVLRSDVAGVLGVLTISAHATPALDATKLVFGVSVPPVTVNGLAAETPSLTVSANSAGVWANGYAVNVAQGTNTGTFKLTVKDDAGNVLEIFDNLTMGDVESKINGVSLFIVVDDNGVLTPPAPSSFSSAVVTAIDYFLSGGLDGVLTISDADYVGTVSPKTGLQTLLNTETVDLNIVAVPGISSGVVVLALLDLCKRRGDCFALIDPPFGLTPQGVADYHNGDGAFDGLHPSFNSSYGAVYYPWVEMFDPINNVRVFTPPSGWVAAQMAFTDFVTNPWFAPAGFNRGFLSNALRVERNLDLGEREFLYGNGNAVNVIVDFTRDGIVIFGQRTLQRAPTALDRINVRRMLLYAQKIISTISKTVLFEPNDALTQTRLEELINPILERIKGDRGIARFSVRIDSTTNTPDVVNNNELRGKLFIEPVKAAEKIILDFVLLATGAEFSGV